MRSNLPASENWRNTYQTGDAWSKLDLRQNISISNHGKKRKSLLGYRAYTTKIRDAAGKMCSEYGGKIPSFGCLCNTFFAKTPPWRWPQKVTETCRRYTTFYNVINSRIFKCTGWFYSHSDENKVSNQQIQPGF